ncbi:MAG TPA: PA2779 family protein [Ramlibacter sp.]|uniref:PA2779 family protein n=1 Tax=Ramlibacter sp. TaxID=1917967 RepID=UPI002ED259F7
MSIRSLRLSRAWRPLLACILSASMSLANAGLIGPEAMTAPSQADLDRAKVQSFMDRATVKERLIAMGVDGLSARDRVASLTEAEAHTLAQRIDAMPAGGALSNQDLIIILLVAILIIVAI